MRFSPISIGITFLVHCGLYLLALVLIHPTGSGKTTAIVQASLPITSQPSLSSSPTPGNTLEVSDLIIPPKALIKVPGDIDDISDDHYFLPEELTQPAQVIQNNAEDVVIPIRQIVIMAIYINERGTVDNVIIEEKGLLTEEEEDQLKNAFNNMIFLPGKRFERNVKALYRIQLNINRRTSIRQ